jgi:DNA (cytosine-5)-methyltransferase 1
MNILNLYAGIGGNRRLWGNEYNITAVEYDKNIANIYESFYPNDTMIIGDAHQYLLDHFSEYDFIWSSPPCPSHSRLRIVDVICGRSKPIYPDMKLYEEILFLSKYFKGKYCVENVISWYKPLIKPYQIGRHYYWANFAIPENKTRKNEFIRIGTIKEKMESKGIDISMFKGINKKRVLNNMVNSEDALTILNYAIKSMSI